MGKYIKALLNNEISVTIIDSTDIISKAIDIHSLSSVAAIALGRALTVCSMMGGELKGERESMTAVINGGGPIGKITVCADSCGNVKGYVDNPAVADCETPDRRPDVSKAVGKSGKLTVVKSMGLKEPYVGVSDIYNGEVTDDFASYFINSEQQTTAVTVGINMEKSLCVNAIGLLIRVLPDCESETLERLNVFLTDVKGINFACGDIEELLHILFTGFSINVISEARAEFICDCGRERIEKIILGMGRGEIFNILVEQGKIEMVCDFCRKRYVFEKDEVIRLVNPSALGVKAES